MISRVAECCFWLTRYMERADSTARLLGVNHDIILDAAIGTTDRWKPLVIVLGEQQGFEKRVGVKGYKSDALCEKYLTWDEKNPASIRSALYWARENARTTREVISREMWELLNSSWQWLNTQGKRAYRADRAQFYQHIRSLCQEFQGLSFNTLSHDEAFDFMCIGSQLERINQTARVMDVKYHWVSEAGTSAAESPQEAALWVALLRLCMGMESFFKQQRAVVTGPLVAGFLLQDHLFPRSVLHCYEQLDPLLERVEGLTHRKTQTKSRKLVRQMIQTLNGRSISAILADSLHDQLTAVINNTGHIGTCLHSEFFDATIRSKDGAASRTTGQRRSKRNPDR